MALEVDFTVIQSNQAELTGTVYDENLRELDLANYTLDLVIKATETTSDVSGTSYTPTVTNAYEGGWSMTIAGTAFATAGTLWYRLDVVDGSGNHLTVNFGTITVKAA